MHLRFASVGAIAIASAVVLAGCTAGDGTGGGDGSTVTLTIESWRTEDLPLWTDKILPEFEKENPGIKVEFTPTNNNEYDSALSTRLQGGTAGDLITCRPFGTTKTNIKAGYLESLEGLPGLENFSDSSLAPWSGDGTPYCVPLASVGAGFFYNKDIFKELNLTVPTTQAELISVLQAIKSNGKYTPLALGGASVDSWALDQMGLEMVGPNYWQGDTGREGIENGTMKFTDPQFVAALEALASWKPFVPDGFSSVTNPDATQLFALGKAAVYADGSWDITPVAANGLNVGVFGAPLPAAGDTQYVQVLPDHAVALNAASKHKAEAKVFLEWLTKPEFATIYADAIPGFFPLNEQPVTLKDPLAQEWLDLRVGATPTLPIGLDAMSEGNPNWSSEAYNILNELMTTNMTGAEAAQKLQSSIESWYPPQMGK
jgi:raffinose/stachyose/melibiose transport system substrate-binding protein